jgi:hypothetical protein
MQEKVGKETEIGSALTQGAYNPHFAPYLSDLKGCDADY